MRSARPILASALFCALAAGGCSVLPSRLVPASLRAPQASVAAGLGSGSGGRAARAPTAGIAALPTPVHLRPCWLFAAPSAADAGGSPVENLRGPGDVGAHDYDAGAVALAGDATTTADTERNGLVYTCRGGFIDLARVRDSADLTMFLTSAMARRLDKGGAIALADEGGTRYITLRKVDWKLVDRHGRRVVAVNLAAWAAFQLAVWQEIAESYGFEPRPGWRERSSSFSPEDLYSSLLGIKLARGIVLDQPTIDDEEDFNRAMDAWVAQAVAILGAVPRQAAQDALASVDGEWWGSNRRPAESPAVRRRHFDLAPAQAPWLVSTSLPGQCDHGPDPVILQSPAELGDVPFAEVATVEIEVDDVLFDRGFPFPRDDSRIVTQGDFAAIVEQIGHQTDR